MLVLAEMHLPIQPTALSVVHYFIVHILYSYQLHVMKNQNIFLLELKIFISLCVLATLTYVLIIST